MEYKTKEEVRKHLKKVANNIGHDSVYEAALDALDHYNMFDWQGSDKLFLAFCEEIANEPEGKKIQERINEKLQKAVSNEK